jgi:hypothetical protein
MRLLGLAAFAAAAALLAACDDHPNLIPPTAVPREAEVLQALPGDEVGDEAFRSGSGASFSEIGRLIGHLDIAEGLSMAVFFDVEAQGDNLLVPGVYVMFVSLGPSGELEYGELAVLVSSRAGIYTLAGTDVDVPFVQGAETAEGAVTIAPERVLDLEDDGVDEMAILVRTERGGVSTEREEVYRREGPHWRRVEDVAATAQPEP